MWSSNFLLLVKKDCTSKSNSPLYSPSESFKQLPVSDVSRTDSQVLNRPQASNKDRYLLRTLVFSYTGAMYEKFLYRMDSAPPSSGPIFLCWYALRAHGANIYQLPFCQKAVKNSIQALHKPDHSKTVELFEV